MFKKKFRAVHDSFGVSASRAVAITFTVRASCPGGCAASRVQYNGAIDNLVSGMMVSWLRRVGQVATSGRGLRLW